MAWEDLRQEVFALTGRQEMSVQTDIAIKQAIRTAHKSGKYWRDLVSVPLLNLPLDDIQEVDLPTQAPKFRQAANLAPFESPYHFLTPITIDELISTDGYNTVRHDVYWGFGSKLRIRAGAPVDRYTLNYYKYPVADPVNGTDSWIVEEHDNLITLWAAMTILQMVGEAEIRARLEQLAAIALADLQQDNLEIQGR